MHLCLEMQWSCYSSQKTGTSLEDFRLVLGRVEPRVHYRWDCSVRWRPKFCICHWGGRGQWGRVYWRTYLTNKIQIRKWIKRGLEVINSIQQISFSSRSQAVFWALDEYWWMRAILILSEKGCRDFRLIHSYWAASPLKTSTKEPSSKATD